MKPDPVTGAEPLSASEQATLLADILDQCQGRQVFFDLDSTLLNNRPRNACIMREFAAAHRQPLLANATAEHFPTWNASDTMASLGLTDDVVERVIDSYMAFWEERFFTSEYCRHDVAIAGAVEFVNAVRGAGGIVHYLTGRNETMRAGTDSCLQALGFSAPDNEGTFLHMKPVLNDSDDDFKLNTLTHLSQTQTILAAFDNEPTHINFYREVFPDAFSVHLHTDHSMRRVRLLKGVVSINDFTCQS